MMWLTWRQFRAASHATALAAVAILLNTGPHLASQYAASGLARCQGDTCAGAASSFLNGLQTGALDHVVYPLGLVLILATPAILGIFWGAPLIAREFEAGTFRLAWNQSVTRTRWLTVKLALTGLAAMAAAEALSLMHAWWADPISKAISLGGGASVFSGNQYSWLTFASHGITPLGYAAFAFALGTAAGTLIRRTVPAMAVTLAIFAVAQVPMPLWVRPVIIPPVQTITTIEAANVNYGSITASVVPGEPEAWVVSSYAITAAGQHVTAMPASCVPSYSPTSKFNGDPGQCMDKLGIREVVNYQPASRYWPLQLIETGIFLALALALAWFCFWRLSRRRTWRPRLKPDRAHRHPIEPPPSGGTAMIWLTWRQFRAQASTAAAVRAAVAIQLGATGPHLASLYAASGLTGCNGDSCANLANSFLNQLTTDGLYHLAYPVSLVVIFVAPAMLGIFWAHR